MPPPRSIPTRSVRLPKHLFSAHAADAGLAGNRKGPSSLQLLQYPVAFNQPNATVPLLSTPGGGALHPHAGGGGPSSSSVVSGGFHSETALSTRRWVRDADELCVDSMRRSDNIHRLNTYVATYKLQDPQWQPLLLPEVHVLRGKRSRQQSEGISNNNNNNNNNSSSHTITGDMDPLVQEVMKSNVPPPPPPHSSAPGLDHVGEDHEVYINYNKLVSLELMSRHANFALKHLVQRGHAMYFITVSQHSILAMRGLVEASYVTCAYGIRGERLRTYLKHIGPLDVRDVLDIDPNTGRVQFDWKRPNVRRGVVATSLVEGYGTWFQRKPMLWQRTRRIGALQAQLGAHQYILPAPESVGRVRECEVSLLEPHISFHGGGDSTAGGGATAVGVIASTQVAQNPKMFMGQFEAPVIAALDSVHQLAHRSALHHRLIRPASASASSQVAAPPAGGIADPAAQEWRKLLGQEALLPVSWTTRTPPPYVPLEADLPFKLQLSRPAVFFDRGVKAAASVGPQSDPVVYPVTAGSTVGSPFVRGVPIAFMEYLIHQGVDHYVFDDAPSARPMKWWNQKSNMPYNGHMYVMRSGLLDAVEPVEEMENPLAPPSPQQRSERRRQRQRRPVSSGSTAEKKRQRRLRMMIKRMEKRNAAKATEAEAAGVLESRPEPEDSASSAEGDPLHVDLSPEVLASDSTYLEGHDDDALSAAQDVMEANAPPAREPFHLLVPPNDIAQRRAQRYYQAALREKKRKMNAQKATTSLHAAPAQGHPRGIVVVDTEERGVSLSAAEPQQDTSDHPPSSSNAEPSSCGASAAGGVVIQRKRWRKRGNARLLKKHGLSGKKNPEGA